ncbi:MAG: shikimate dehydrogenase [Planctomycetota bacterium]|nr:MAG: shikimate dehydrogenase [Planctomycetota bacterium]
MRRESSLRENLKGKSKEKSLLLGLIGKGIDYSLSPWIFQRFFEYLKIPGKYKLFDIQVKEELKGFFKKAQYQGLKGVNLTIPYKTFLPEGFQYSGAANEIQVANVLDFQKKIAWNTDWIGIRSALQKYKRRWKKGLVLGAGGAARSALFLLQEWKIETGLLNRSPEKACQLQKRFFPHVKILNWKEVSTFQPDLVIHATPLGGPNFTDQLIWPLTVPIPKGAFLLDLNYSPSKTLLMQYWEKNGEKSENGLDMLFYQAFYGLEIWLDQHLPLSLVDQIRKDYLNIRED